VSDHDQALAKKLADDVRAANCWAWSFLGALLVAAALVIFAGWMGWLA
jgi:hypothetical protein